MELSQETLAKIDVRVEKYPSKRSAALPLLHLVQEEKGHVPDEAIEWVARRLELEPINIYEIVTFYPMLKRKPVGKQHVRANSRRPPPTGSSPSSSWSVWPVAELRRSSWSTRSITKTWTMKKPLPSAVS